MTSMKNTKVVWDAEGKRREVDRVAGWLPPEHMRKLPGDYYTQDTSDPDRVHELDDPHIVEALVAEQDKKNIEEEKLVGLPAAKAAADEALAFKNIPFTQENIDWIRFKTISNLVKSAITQIERQLPRTVKLNGKQHLWFPNANFEIVELREGNAPADVDRPGHLKGKHLFVDVLHWPVSIEQKMKAKGIDLPNVQVLLEKTKPVIMLDEKLRPVDETH